MPKILLVEDNELNRDSLSRLLKRQGFDVIFAVDGAEGVRVALAEQPDLVLMDIGLPLMDGFEATQTLRQQGGTMPIIALTAHALQSDQAKALTMGCNDFETKPVEFQQLMGKIKKLLGMET